MKKFLIIVGIVVLALAIAVYTQVPKFRIVTGYSSKYLCSYYFNSNRDWDEIIKSDLSYGFFKYASYSKDEDNKTVTARFLGFLTPQTAQWREGFGATLLSQGKILPTMQLHRNKRIPTASTWPVDRGTHPKIDSLFDMQKLRSTLNDIFADIQEDGQGTRAVVVLYDTILVAQGYDTARVNKDSRMLGWSMSKSITADLLAIAQEQGKLDISSPAPISAWQEDERKTITIADLLHMNSGLEWNEDYGAVTDVTTMLYNSGDMAAFTAAKPLEHKPNNFWYYSSGTTNILSHILKESFDTQDEYNDFPYKYLFDKISTDPIFEQDETGTYTGSSYVYATAVDWARFGLLHLKRGKWQGGEQIIPDTWFDYITEAAIGSNDKYGAQVWLNKGNKFPDLPKDMHSFDGHHGQIVMVIPSENMVIVRLGLNESPKFDYNKFGKAILDCKR
ncbi:MAG: serine hydrolase domain-containing protein [Bacteroidales bacterium]